MAWIETHFHSETLGMEMTVNVILPQTSLAVAPDRSKLKTLWLLHGGSGDDTAWLRMTAVERYALAYGIAVVMPGGFHSCFTDMKHGGRFHTYLTEELPAVIRHLFPRLSAQREDNYVSGFSNGGYACLKAGLARPDLYAAIGAFSAGDKSDVAFVDDGSPRAKERMMLFGDGDMKNTDNDLQYLARKALKNGAELPAIYHACGSLDPWLDLNVILREFFTGLPNDPYRYQYREAEGLGHTWEFWDAELPRFLDGLGLEKDKNQYFAL
ncbi:alpha/beta hydrolase [Paenibacillus chartarius]|uniref:Alpha/beta hydrolase n=1 Tax=Paenibacillus chartarius TaxID=747481 RepID=A0ABV6DPR3_9BACL